MGFQVVHLGRHPPPKGLVDKAFYALGSVLRSLGEALDSVGTAVQGPTAVKEQLTPNTAWLPFVADGAASSSSGAGGGSSSSRAAALKGVPRLDITEPVKGDGTFVAPNATVIGNVKIGAGASVWYGATLRGDINAISIGDKTNVQDNVVIHVARHSLPSAAPRPTRVGARCTIGHGATLHACEVGDGCLVGMGATLLDGVTMAPGSIVAAGAVVPPGTSIKTGEVWAGSPAKLLRSLSPEEGAFVSASADNYAKLAVEHRIENGKVFEELVLDKKIAEERSWRDKTDIDIHQGILRDPQTQVILSMR